MNLVIQQQRVVLPLPDFSGATPRCRGSRTRLCIDALLREIDAVWGTGDDGIEVSVPVRCMRFESRDENVVPLTREKEVSKSRVIGTNNPVKLYHINRDV
jgi:hypothetical protein